MTPVNLEPAVQAVRTRLSEILPPLEFYVHASPILILLIGALVALFVGIFRSDPEKPNYPGFWICMLSCLGAALPPALITLVKPQAYLGSGFLVDELTQFSFMLIALGTLFTLMAASFTTVGRQLLRPDFLCLLLFSSAGMMMMSSAGEFMTFFTGLEIMSVSLYVLVGYQRRENRALEAAMKYFLLGSTAAAMLLLGMALLYMHTGSLKWADLRYLTISKENPLAMLGMLLLICGFAFKLAVAPFHSWAPDVYQGSHSLLTGYMTTLVKASIVIVMIRIFGAGIANPSGAMVWIFSLLGGASIIVGSLFGLVHNSVKRMLAYSSVANAGYFCLGFATLAVNPRSLMAREALVAYVVIYAVLNLGAFAVLSWLEEGNREDLLKDELAGLGSRHPFAAFSLSVFLLGIAGIPPVAGFFGKFLLINSAVSEGLYAIAILLVVMSCASLYYYLSIMVEMWLKPASRSSIHPLITEETSPMKYLVGLAVALSILIGIFGPRWASHIRFTPASETVPAASAQIMP
jgi:NADH-quinone oxidoreductase subunit N